MEGGFYIGCQVNEMELKEILLRRYGKYVFPDMKFDEFIEFVSLAVTKERKEEVRGEYLVLLPLIIRSGKYITFDQFFDERTGANIDWRPSDEILKEAEQIQERFKNGS